MTGCITSGKIAGLKKLLEGARKVALAGHVHPDGDAVGCVTALALYLRRELGKEVVCMFPDALPESLHFLISDLMMFVFLIILVALMVIMKQILKKVGLLC